MGKLSDWERQRRITELQKDVDRELGQARACRASGDTTGAELHEVLVVGYRLKLFKAECLL